MAALTKGSAVNLLSLQTVAASSVAVGTSENLDTELGGSVHIRFGRESATAAGAGVNIRVEYSPDNVAWFPAAIITTNFAACEGEAVSGTEAAGQTVIGAASTTNLTTGDIIFFLNGTIANSEWHRIKSIVASTSVTLEDAIVNAQTSSTMYDAAEIYAPIEIPPAARYIRVVADGSLFTQAFAIQAVFIPITAIS
jgi:hypothetical protein